MYDLYPLAVFFMILTIAGLFYHAVISVPMSKYDVLVQFATYCCVMMNSFWMLGDYIDDKVLDILKTVFMMLGVVSIFLVACTDIGKLRSIRRFNK